MLLEFGEERDGGCWIVGLFACVIAVGFWLFANGCCDLVVCFILIGEAPATTNCDP